MTSAGVDGKNNLARLLARLFLVGSLLGLTAFYLLLYKRDNAAPSFDISKFQTSDSGEFQYQLDRCHSGEKKVAVTGWATRKGRGATRRSMRVIVIDGADGSAYALKTELQERADVTKLLNQRFSDHVQYRHAGFSASLNLKTASRNIANGRLYLAYDDGDARVLLPLSCNLQWPR